MQAQHKNVVTHIASASNTVASLSVRSLLATLVAPCWHPVQQGRPHAAAFDCQILASRHIHYCQLHICLLYFILLQKIIFMSHRKLPAAAHKRTSFAFYQYGSCSCL
jgi:hypothetical protein